MKNYQFNIEVGLPATYRQQLICAGILKPYDQSVVLWLINNHLLYSIPAHIVMYLKTLVDVGETL